jgi:tRNA 2-thiouridine synthesizing protein A
VHPTSRGEMATGGNILVDSTKYPDYLRLMGQSDHILDAIGLLCPLPVLKARKRLMAMADGSVLKLLADDPAAVVDVPHFCAEAGHVLVGQSEGDGCQIYLIRKGG